MEWRVQIEAPAAFVGNVPEGYRVARQVLARATFARDRHTRPAAGSSRAEDGR